MTHVNKLSQGQFPGNGSQEKDRELPFALPEKGVGTSVACRDKRVPYLLLKGLSPGMMWVLSLPAKSLMRS